MREHGKLRFNPVPWLLEMAVQDGAFLHFDSLETLKNWNPDNNEPIPLLWRPSVATEPVLRQVTRFGGLSNSAWTRECFCRLFRAVVVNAGYPEIITIHTLRRGLANRLDSKIQSSCTTGRNVLTFSYRSSDRVREKPDPYTKGSQCVWKKLHRQHLGCQ
jgi:hypothetical protein